MRHLLWLGLAGCVFITPDEVALRTQPTPVPTPVPTPGPVDADGDGFFEDEDCDDSDSDVFPGAEEQPNQVDDDCDGAIDEGTIFYDDDGDGFCEQNPCAASCGLSDCSGDCDDTRAVVYPGAEEICDGLANDCLFDGDEHTDRDGDGWSVAQGDPDDLDVTELPGELQRIQASVVCQIARIEPGAFTMGCEEPWCAFDEQPEHQVTISHTLLVMETEVSRAPYDRFMGPKEWAFPSCGTNCPVTRVSWEEAFAFAEQMNQFSGLPSCDTDDDPRDCLGWRLPTEAEWEWIARQNRSDRFAGGSNPALVGWFDDNGMDTVHPTRLKVPTPEGVYDLTGNVWEWVWDAPARYPSTDEVDPVVFIAEDEDDIGRRMLRGAGAQSPFDDAHVTIRNWGSELAEDYADSGDESDLSPFNPLNYHGFRLVRRAP